MITKLVNVIDKLVSQFCIPIIDVVQFVHANKCFFYVFQYPGTFSENDSIFAAATLDQLGDVLPPPISSHGLKKRVV